METRPSFFRKLLAVATFGLVYSNLPIAGIDEPHKREGARKSSGGSGRRLKRRMANPSYHAWKKAFGGLAVPEFIG